MSNENLLQEQGLDVDTLRSAIQAEYAEVADNPGKGFHFHTGRRLAGILEYPDEWRMTYRRWRPGPARTVAGAGGPWYATRSYTAYMSWRISAGGRRRPPATCGTARAVRWRRRARGSAAGR